MERKAACRIMCRIGSKPWLCHSLALNSLNPDRYQQKVTLLLVTCFGYYRIHNFCKFKPIFRDEKENLSKQKSKQKLWDMEREDWEFFWALLWHL